ncbi:Dolichyl-phosphate-mannose-protein mannosyltransferase [Alicyclobacillus hesperidum]|uniref:Dolichyl-phosphate-mannose-protein mannosyltransferase n=1 Tax=Alicyclobacillus hesperidum TaxID=89784 RepID=A0A1H2WQW5_9BACL|nr:mannosyltransferase family protein [Alicyclobacillus hesperidum]SDW82369.1 Dolichyl-phosphate-mannose-protein mannosyltransferase [Alicyclobacillus hesperidum]
MTKRFIEAVSLYAISKAIMLAGSILALKSAAIPLSKLLYFAVVYSSYHDDATWYSAISSFGYIREEAPFWPGWPLLVTGVHILTGTSVVTSGIVLANCLQIIDIGLILELFRKLLGSETGKIAGILWAVYPMSVFLSSDYTEPLFILGMIGTMLFLHDRRYWEAGIFAGIATITRNSGVLLVIPIGYSIWSDYRTHGRVRLKSYLPFLSIIVSFVGYCIYLWFKFDSPVLWSTMEKLWGRQFEWPWITLIKGVWVLPHVWRSSGGYGHVYYALQYGSVFLALASLPTVWRRLPRSWFWLLMAQIVLPLCDPGIGAQAITGYTKHITDYFFSFDRFTLTMIPVFAALALRLREINFIKPKWIYTVYATGTALCTNVALTLHMFIG